MTIKEKIDTALSEMGQGGDKQAYDICYKLHGSFDAIIRQARDHLGKIQTQMPDYDGHGSEHSDKVLRNIECLLRDEGIEKLTLLEAMLIELCCFFHDTGMAMPDWGFALLKQVEADGYVYHSQQPISSITGELKRDPSKLAVRYEDVKDLFLCPGSEKDLLDFWAKEILAYERYRMGIPAPAEGQDRAVYDRLARQEYLRGTHGKRSRAYAEHIDRKLTVLDQYDARVVAQAVGDICLAHGQDIQRVRALDTSVRICRGKCSGDALTFNTRFIAQLLRLGDIIHFSADRASRTLYAEHMPMDPDSDRHWKVKLSELHYQIEQQDGRTNILYVAGFTDPKLYYFLQDYLDRVDEELQNYATFVQDMEQTDKHDAGRYRLGLPTNVDRSGIRSLGFTPDERLKFRLEQQKIVELLMGMRLYSDEFMCLRELYQNALDACRCMRAQNQKSGLSGELAIEFGLGEDEHGTYLFCRDEGVGMRKQVVVNYLLRVGNSYYRSADFRRENILWDNAVAPISEFGIGLLSCYMIGSRIEIITRHYSRDAEACWVCMEGAEDYGYYRAVTPDVEEWINGHGTIVKVYLKDAFRQRIDPFLPDDPADAVYQLDTYDSQVNNARMLRERQTPAFDLPPEHKERLDRFRNSLYRRVQEFVSIPEDGIPVYILGECGSRARLITSSDPYDLPRKLPLLERCGFPPLAALRLHWPSGYSQDVQDSLVEWTGQFSYHSCKVTDPQTGSEAHAILHLPDAGYQDHTYRQYANLDVHTGSTSDFCIDGIPLPSGSYMLRPPLRERGILYNFKGGARPVLSVNREDIRSIPKELNGCRDRLHAQLVEQIAEAVRAHFDADAGIKTQPSLAYVIEYLYVKFNLETFCRIMERLSAGVFSDYEENGLRLSAIFGQSDLRLPLFASAFSKHYQALIGWTLLPYAERIAVEDDAVSVKRVQNAPCQVLTLDGNEASVCRCTWSGKYSQYDIVSNEWDLIPERVFALCEPKQTLTDNAIALPAHYAGLNLPSILRLDSFDFLKDRNNIDRSDIILFLDAEPDSQILHRWSLSSPLDKPDRKYVLYVYIHPRPLSKREEEYLKLYANKPAITRGIREGWSILFYRYSNGYIIAPGIVPREELAKRIPAKARAHDTRVQYLFTDGTAAF